MNKSFLIIALCVVLAGCASNPDNGTALSANDVAHAEKLAALQFTSAERKQMLPLLKDQRDAYVKGREISLPNSVRPLLVFDPTLYVDANPPEGEPQFATHKDCQRPAQLDELAFASLTELGCLLRTQKVTSVELTKLALARLKKYDAKLHAVVTLTPELALKQARAADAQIAAGHYRGPLQGIPYGIKDLFSVPGYPTTWGAKPFEHQTLDDTATVVRKLEDAGAVLVAKLSSGALAMGDVWFGGKTRNPWNLAQGSSGSSAGPAAAVSAGLVPFAVGTETWGSIVSPASRVGISGLRPTFGRVSRAGAMALSWSMDKPGPLCRNLDDCALVFDAIRGTDGLDPSVHDAPFAYRGALPLKGMTIGYLKSDFAADYAGHDLDQAALDKLRELGAELVPIELPDLPLENMPNILDAEAAAAFDDLTRSNRDDLLVAQDKDAWPNLFRAARFIPAVEYIQAQRTRTLLLEQMGELMKQVDVYVAPSLEGNNLLVNNLDGQPCVVVPDGFVKPDAPHSISFIGRWYDEATVLGVAKTYQDAVSFDNRHPPGFHGLIGGGLRLDAGPINLPHRNHLGFAVGAHFQVSDPIANAG